MISVFKSFRSKRGISLIETLIVVSGLGLFASLGVAVYSNTSKSAMKAKTLSDIETINRAVTFHVANFGEMPASWDAEDVIRALKSSVSDESARTHVGLTQSSIDLRLTPVWVSPDSEGKEGPRIVWDSDLLTFLYEDEATGPGILRFELSDQDESEILEDLEAQGLYVYAKDGGWIWDFENEAKNQAFTPTAITTTPIEVALPPEAQPISAELSSPVFSIQGGVFELSEFPLNLTIGNPNDSGSIVLQRNDNPVSYLGQSITLLPHEEIFAYVEANTNGSTSSGRIRYFYDVNPLKLEVSSNPISSVNYYQLMDSEINVSLEIVNESSIPSFLDGANLYSVVWSNGSEVISGESELRLVPSLWGDESSITLTTSARSNNTELITSSDTETFGVTANQLTLPTPVIQLTEQDDMSYQVTIESDRIPSRASIHYEIHTPAGTPIVSGASNNYEGPFNWTPTEDNQLLSISAKVILPDSLNLWFQEGETATQTVDLNSGGNGSASIVVVSNLQVDGEVVGSVQLLNASNLNLNSSTNIDGSLLLPGSPNFNINGSVDFDIVEGSGPADVGNYNVNINSGAQIETIITQSVPQEVPVVEAPPATSGSFVNVDSGSNLPSFFPNSGVNINSNAGSVALPPGNYGTVNAGNSNNGEIVLGNADGSAAEYTFSRFTLNSGVSVRLVSPVVITAENLIVNSGSTIGNPDSPQDLTINVSGQQFTDNANGTIFAGSILAPNANVQVNGTIHTSGLLADRLTVNSSGRLVVE